MKKESKVKAEHFKFLDVTNGINVPNMMYVVIG